MEESRRRCVDVNLADGGVLRAEPVTPHTFRIRLRQDNQFREPSLIRYGIVRNNWEPVDFSTEDIDAMITIRTDGASLSINKKDGRLALAESVTLTISPRSGSYEGMPERRHYNIHIHSDTAPKSIELNAVPLAFSEWHYDEDAGVIRAAASEKPDRSEPIVIICSY